MTNRITHTHSGRGKAGKFSDAFATFLFPFWPRQGLNWQHSTKVAKRKGRGCRCGCDGWWEICQGCRL